MKIIVNGETVEVCGGGDSTPIKPMSKMEYDALTEEDKQSDVVYAITDDAGSSGGAVDNNVYSTEERRVGTWIDGKPLYRITLIKENYSQSGDVVVRSLAEYNIGMLVSVVGGFTAQGGIISVNTKYAGETSYEFSFLIGSDQFAIFRGVCTSLGLGTGTVTIEYTKTTDEQEAAT